jgi:hypothetical protein
MISRSLVQLYDSASRIEWEGKITDETLKTTEQTKNNTSSFLFAMMVLQMKKEDATYARNKND